MNNKRRDTSPATNNLGKRPRKVCNYGESCYRRNPAHLREFSHPHLELVLDNYSGNGEFPIPDNLQLQRVMMEEQLQIILEKNIYSPSNSSVNSDGSDKKEKKNVISQDLIDGPEGSKHDTANESKIKQEEEKESKYKQIAAKESIVKQEEEKASSSKHDTVMLGVGDSNKVKKEFRLEDQQSKEIKVLENEGAKLDPTAKALSYSDYRPIVPPKRNIHDHFKVVLPKGRMLKKHQYFAPYHIFYTTITDSKDTHKQMNSITFQEILDHSLGELKCSLQINFMVDIGWLLAQYYFAGYSQKRLTILYGDNNPDLVSIGKKQKHVDAHFVSMATSFGKHHTKMMLLCYENGSLRVVISTANLYIDDWENRTQGLWMSPACPELPEGCMPHEGESPTMFKRCLLEYLDHYRLGYLTQYTERVRRCDFSHINVFLIASAPGSHFDNKWGMLRMGNLLSQHCADPGVEPATVIAQSSSLGSFGHHSGSWLKGDFFANFSRTKADTALASSQPKLKVIYPSLENVQKSHDGLLGGGCLPYSASVHTKQLWLKEYLYQWKAERTLRDRAMPHIKTYMRVSEDCKKAYYFLLTSGNISKAAWGTVNKGNKALRIMSYEAGVLFIPQFVLNKDHFPLDRSEKDHLPIVYDLPPIKYTNSMSPFVQDYLMD